MENLNQKYEFNNRFYKTLSAMKRAETILKKAQAKNAKRIAYLQKIGEQKFNEINAKREATKNFGEYKLPNYINDRTKPIQKPQSERIEIHKKSYKYKNQPQDLNVNEDLSEGHKRNIKKVINEALNGAFKVIKITNEIFNKDFSKIRDIDLF
jgi:hypothetical protein